MYNDYIKNKKIEIIEYDLSLMIDYIIILIKLLIKYEKSFEIRKKLSNLIKKYIEYTKLEYEILNYIESLVDKLEYEDICSELLDYLEQRFEITYLKLDNIFKGIEDGLNYGNMSYANFQEYDFDINNIQDKFRKVKEISS